MPSPTQPVMTIVAGPNGSGKTTLTRHLARRGIDLGIYINPDDIAPTLSGSDAERTLDAQRLAEERRRLCLQRREDFTFETVMSHPDKIAFMREAKAAGYFVLLIFVGIEDPAINIARVEQRVRLGGHDVPTGKIIARWQRTMAALPDAIKASDRALLFDNTVTISKPGEVTPPQAAAEFIDGKLAQIDAASLPGWLRDCIAQLS